MANVAARYLLALVVFASPACAANFSTQVLKGFACMQTLDQRVAATTHAVCGWPAALMRALV